MLKQFSSMKKGLAVLLAVFFVVSLTEQSQLVHGEAMAAGTDTARMATVAGENLVGVCLDPAVDHLFVNLPLQWSVHLFLQ